MNFLKNLKVFIINRELIYTLTRREILARYRGSFFGVLWSFLIPLFMLGIYTFVFGFVFQVRLGNSDGSQAEFALVLFAGLMPFYIFSETVTRAPTLILSNINYVKRIVFPLEILPVVSLGVAIFQYSINFMVWLAFLIALRGFPPSTIFLLPFILFPFFLIILGLSWFLASLGVYVRDLGQLIGVIVTILMFLSPLFYPLSALPQSYRILMYLNPLTYVIEHGRAIMIWGETPSLSSWIAYLLVSLLVGSTGLWWFNKTKKGFADVI